MQRAGVMADTSDTPEGDAEPDAIRQLRRLPGRYREALGGRGGEEPTAGAEALPFEAVEEAAHARDLLDSTARRVERLLEDSKPVGDEAENRPPRRGHYRVDPDIVLEVLDSNAERLAQLVEGVPAAAGERGSAVRDGLESITGELVSEVVTESERRLQQVQRAVDEGE